MSQTVAYPRVGAPDQSRVKHIFGLIGETRVPLGDAVRRSDTEWIGVRHEEGAALAASGQVKLTGRLAVCAGTTGPGSTHSSQGLTKPAATMCPPWRSPATCRENAGTDFFQASEPDLLFRNVALYTETVSVPA